MARSLLPWASIGNSRTNVWHARERRGWAADREVRRDVRAPSVHVRAIVRGKPRTVVGHKWPAVLSYEMGRAYDAGRIMPLV
jgi:hypothetical protein